MSHFTSLKTRFVDLAYLRKALEDLGYVAQAGGVAIRGYQGNRTRVDLKIATKNPGYDIGFKQAGDHYELVADWWGIRDLEPESFLQKVTQRYAYHATRAKLEEQGFALVEEKKEEERIHLVLRRVT